MLPPHQRAGLGAHGRKERRGRLLNDWYGWSWLADESVLAGGEEHRGEDEFGGEKDEPLPGDLNVRRLFPGLVYDL